MNIVVQDCMSSAPAFTIMLSSGLMFSFNHVNFSVNIQNSNEIDCMNIMAQNYDAVMTPNSIPTPHPILNFSDCSHSLGNFSFSTHMLVYSNMIDLVINNFTMIDVFPVSLNIKSWRLNFQVFMVMYSSINMTNSKFM